MLPFTVCGTMFSRRYKWVHYFKLYCFFSQKYKHLSAMFVESVTSHCWVIYIPYFFRVRKSAQPSPSHELFGARLFRVSPRNTSLTSSHGLLCLCFFCGLYGNNKTARVICMYSFLFFFFLWNHAVYKSVFKFVLM